MAAVLPTLIRTGAVALGSAIAGIGYAALVERNAFVLREVTMPVLTPGSTPLRVLHISDLHMLPNQHRKQAWLRELASWEPDLVVNTGDNLAHPKAVPAVVQTLSDLLSRPGVFVFGSNDYFGPRLKNPMNYLTSPDHRVRGAALPWQDLRAAFTERGWLDLTQNRHHRGAPVGRLRGLHQPLRGGELHLRRLQLADRSVFRPAAPLRQRRLVRRQRAIPHLVRRDEADRQQLRRSAATTDRSTLCRRRTRLTGTKRGRSGCRRRTPAPQGRGLPGRRPNQLGQQLRQVW